MLDRDAQLLCRLDQLTGGAMDSSDGSQLELAIVEYVSWFNHERLHESLADRPPAEVEALYAKQYVLITPSPT